ncbi:MAG: putative dehydrogenase [Verrucomicrobiales bacterium]|jgi:predicted dehydrogenase
MSNDIKVEVLGAGSIGNHLAHACRNKGWSVRMSDLDPAALERTRTEIYPERYGSWDEGIELRVADGNLDIGDADLVIIGTPPDSHSKLILDSLKSGNPKVILVEKPLATPDLKGCAEVWKAANESDCTVLVDYNHTATPNTEFAEQLLAGDSLGTPRTIQVRWIEHWGGIYKAHPWLSGPAATYLGFSSRGGGACGEHSHGINIWQHFAKRAGAGRVVEVSAMLDQVSEGGADYDRVCQLNLRAESGLCGFVVQDVVTDPAVKSVRFQGESGFFEWHANFESGFDAVIHGDAAKQETERFAKGRPDDFKGMIEQVGRLISGELSPDNAVGKLEDGLETMLVIAAAFESQKTGKTIKIDYSQGFSAAALTQV